MSSYKFPYVNPVRFHHITDGDFAYNLIPSFEYLKGYNQLYQHGDRPVIQLLSDNSGAIITLSFIDMTGAAVGIYKQILGAPAYTYDAVNVFELNLEIPPASIAPAGIYCMKLVIGDDNGTVTFYSEPIHIAASHTDSVLIEYGHDANDFERYWIAESGQQPFKSQLRIEGGVRSDGFQPGGKYSMFQDQDYNSVMLNSQPYNVEKWTFGGSIGIPNWLGDKLNRILSLSDVTIDGVAYQRSEGAKLERIGDADYPLAGWAVDLIKAENPYSEEFSTGVTNVYANNETILANSTQSVLITTI